MLLNVIYHTYGHLGYLLWILTGGMQVESGQGYKDPSKAAATVARPEERGDLGQRMQGTMGAEAGAGQGGKVYLGI